MKQKLNIKLNELNARELDRTEKQMVKGGEELPLDCCGCGCCYDGEPGGSSSQANMLANHELHWYSPCATEYMVCITAGVPSVQTGTCGPGANQ